MIKYFIAGFVAGEGSFGVYKVKKRPNSYNVLFTINVHKRDLNFLRTIRQTLKCGYVKIYNSRSNIARFQVARKKEIIEKVIPFFDKYLTDSYKKKQYEKWRRKVIKIWGKEKEE